MRIRLVRVFLSILLLLFVNCGLFEPPPAVRILKPKKGEILIKGEAFQVMAEIDVDFKIKELRVGLWDVVKHYDTILDEETEYDTTLWVYSFTYEEADFLREFTIEKELTVPTNAPVGDNYRLDFLTRAWENTYGIGYSLLVRVHSPND